MKAAVFKETGKDLSIEDVPEQDRRKLSEQ